VSLLFPCDVVAIIDHCGTPGGRPPQAFQHPPAGGCSIESVATPLHTLASMLPRRVVTQTSRGSRNRAYRIIMPTSPNLSVSGKEGLGYPLLLAHLGFTPGRSKLLSLYRVWRRRCQQLFTKNWSWVSVARSQVDPVIEMATPRPQMSTSH
jgi:hypothetical protein